MVALPCVTGAGPTGGFCKSQLRDQPRVIACTESSVRTEESWEGKIRTHPDHRWDKFAHFKELSGPNHEHIPCTQLKVNRRPCPGVPPDPFLPRDGTTASWAEFTGVFAPHSVICWYPLHRHWPTGLSLEHQEGLTLHICHFTYAKRPFVFSVTTSLGEPLSARMAAFLLTTIQDGQGHMSIAPTHPPQYPLEATSSAPPHCFSFSFVPSGTPTGVFSTLATHNVGSSYMHLVIVLFTLSGP